VEGNQEKLHMRSGGCDQQPDCPGCQRLQELLDAALHQLSETQQQLADVRQHVAKLNRRVEQLEQEGKRQAAPFRRPESKRKNNKAKPGRKPGHPASWRKPPPTVDEFAEVPLDRCPQCGGALRDVRPIKQVIEDIPVIRVHRLHLTTYRGHCPNCGSVCSRHPEQVSDATGAAGTHLGRRALALAADLNKHFGLTMRKTTALLDEHFGLSITPGGLSQALARTAGKLRRPFDELCRAVRASAAIHADETGWWVGGQSAWLWVFANSGLTRHTIDNRSQHVIRRVLGDDYAGVLISDCLASYNPHPGRKSKCCAHHLKAISEAQAEAPDSGFLAEIRALLKAAMVLHGVREQMCDELDEARYRAGVAHLERRPDELLAAPHGHAAEVRIVNRLAKQRPHLLTFLHVPGVDPTNNLAERQLRPAVIARKLSCGNKTQAGAFTFEVLASLAATCRQQGRSFAGLVAECLRLGRGPPPLFAAE